MRIVFLSNYYNHHQAYLSRKLYALTDGNYNFIASTRVSESRKKLGYAEFKDDFVISCDESGQDVQAIIDSADVVICGSAPESWINNRKQQGKLILRYSERPLKKGFQLWKYPYRFLKLHKQNPRNARIYMLCASAYTAADYSKFGLFKDKCFKWGYFPECKYYESVEALMNGKIENEVLWCGRFLDWKHPDDVLSVAKRLKEDGRVFHINIIGTGEMQNELEVLRDQYELSEYVTFVGSVSADKVREYMEKASIYLFTSDKQEGWGAVLNEAMNSGCAVVASSAAGATPYLIRNQENGIIYPSGNKEALYGAVTQLLVDNNMQRNLGRKAYETIVNEWNSDVAAQRLIALAECLLFDNKSDDIYEDGPCSKA